jgi:hypothetical protein
MADALLFVPACAQTLEMDEVIVEWPELLYC